MKVAILTMADLPMPAVRGGAVETLIDSIISQNELQGKLELSIFSIYDDTAKKQASNYRNTEFYYYEKSQKRSLVTETASKVLRKISHNRIPYIPIHMKDIVHKVNEMDCDYLVIASSFLEIEWISKKTKARLIWYLHSDPLSYLTTGQCQKIIDSCYAVFTVSDFVKNQVLPLCGDKQVTTILNCCDIKRPDEDEYQKLRKSVRSKYGVDEKELLFIYVGRINPIKGVYELISAFQTLQGSRIKLLVVGAPNQSEEEKAYDQRCKHNSGENVTYAGYIGHHELSGVYAAADVAVVPSVCNEAAPLSVIEPMVLHVPLIATNIGGIPEHMSPGAGLLVEYDNHFIDHLAEALRKISELHRSGNMPSDFSRFQDFFSPERYYSDFCAAFD